jgi:16S rRNA (cytidine1402-2'-O)-methyltransferase
MGEPELIIVAMPLGNIKDITFRAVEVLSGVDHVACEDTRETARMFSELGISAKLFSYHEHNKEEASEYILKLLREGKRIAIVSDAGTPCISDPGYLAVKKARKESFRVTPVPGASAPISALSVSGFASDSFFFQGFIHEKSTEKRRNKLKELISLDTTIILFEAPHRILRLLGEIKDVRPEMEVFIGREMTKKYEEFITGSPQKLLEHFSTKNPRGEFVVILNKLERKIKMSDEEIALEFEKIKNEAVDEKEAMKLIAKKTGRSKSEIYGILKK